MVVRKIETAEKVWYCKTADLKTGIIIKEHRSAQGDVITPSAFTGNDAVDTKKNQREDQSSVSKLGMFGDDEIERHQRIPGGKQQCFAISSESLPEINRSSQSAKGIAQDHEKRNSFRYTILGEKGNKPVQRI